MEQQVIPSKVRKENKSERPESFSAEIRNVLRQLELNEFMGFKGVYKAKDKKNRILNTKWNINL